MSKAELEIHHRLAALTEWSEWRAYEEAVGDAPRLPGVYLFRAPSTGQVVYVGMAGERAGGGRPQGLRGRLSVYKSGKGAVSGFGEAALDRALADPVWVEQQLALLRSNGPRRAKLWAADAIRRECLQMFAGRCASTDQRRVRWRSGSRGSWMDRDCGTGDRSSWMLTG